MGAANLNHEVKPPPNLSHNFETSQRMLINKSIDGPEFLNWRGSTMCMILMKKVIESNRIQLYKRVGCPDFVIPGPHDKFKEI